MGGGIHGGFGPTKGYLSAVSGNAVYKSKDKLYFEYISRRKDIDENGVYDFVAHGLPDKIQIEHNNENIQINSRVASNLIKNRSDYKKGQAIRLLSCYTGKYENGFAQSLANKLGVIVYAPTEIVWAYPSGRHIVAAMGANNQPDLNKKGKMKKFIPGGNKNAK